MPDALRQLIVNKLDEAKSLGILLEATPSKVTRNKYFQEIVTDDPDSWEIAVESAIFGMVN